MSPFSSAALRAGVSEGLWEFFSWQRKQEKRARVSAVSRVEKTFSMMSWVITSSSTEFILG